MLQPEAPVPFEDGLFSIALSKNPVKLEFCMWLQYLRWSYCCTIMPNLQCMLNTSASLYSQIAGA